MLNIPTTHASKATSGLNNGLVALGGNLPGYADLRDVVSLDDPDTPADREIRYTAIDGKNVEWGTCTVTVLGFLSNLVIDKTIKSGVLESTAPTHINYKADTLIYMFDPDKYQALAMLDQDVGQTASPVFAGLNVTGPTQLSGAVTVGDVLSVGSVGWTPGSNTVNAAGGVNVSRNRNFAFRNGDGTATSILDDYNQDMLRLRIGAAAVTALEATASLFDMKTAAKVGGDLSVTGDVLAGASSRMTANLITDALVASGSSIGTSAGLQELHGWRQSSDSGRVGVWSAHNHNSADTTNHKAIYSLEAWTTGVTAEAGMAKLKLNDGAGAMVEVLTATDSLFDINIDARVGGALECGSTLQLKNEASLLLPSAIGKDGLCMMASDLGVPVYSQGGVWKRFSDNTAI